MAASLLGGAAHHVLPCTFASPHVSMAVRHCRSARHHRVQLACAFFGGVGGWGVGVCLVYARCQVPPVCSSSSGVCTACADGVCDGACLFYCVCVHIPTTSQSWRAMESMVDKGLVKSLGVSNINAAQLKELIQHVQCSIATPSTPFHHLHPPALQQSRSLT